jgi:transcriptional regulator with XRE-family HTH domain
MPNAPSAAHDIRKRVREAVAAGIWQQIELAERAGIDASHFSRFLRRSDERGLSAARLHALAQVLDAGPQTGEQAPLPPAHVRALAEKLRDGQLALFVGFGLSHLAPHRESRAQRLPLWPALAARVAKAWGDREAASVFPDPLDLFDHILYASSRDRLEEAVRHALDDRSHVPAFTHMLLRELPWSAVLTTSYDGLLQQELVEKAISSEEEYARLKPGDAPRLFQLHGTLANPHTLTREDHRSWPTRHPRAMAYLRERLHHQSILFIGHSVLDSHLADLVAQLRDWTDDAAVYAWMWRAPEAHLALARRRDHMEAVSLRTEEEFEAAIGQVLDELKRLRHATSTA